MLSDCFRDRTEKTEAAKSLMEPNFLSLSLSSTTGFEESSHFVDFAVVFGVALGFVFGFTDGLKRDASPPWPDPAGPGPLAGFCGRCSTSLKPAPMMNEADAGKATSMAMGWPAWP